MAYPNSSGTMPTPTSGKYHLYAPDLYVGTDPGTCFWCGQNEAAHFT